MQFAQWSFQSSWYLWKRSDAWIFFGSYATEVSTGFDLFSWWDTILGGKKVVQIPSPPRLKMFACSAEEPSMSRMYQWIFGFLSLNFEGSDTSTKCKSRGHQFHKYCGRNYSVSQFLFWEVILYPFYQTQRHVSYIHQHVGFWVVENRKSWNKFDSFSNPNIWIIIKRIRGTEQKCFGRPSLE